MQEIVSCGARTVIQGGVVGVKAGLHALDGLWWDSKTAALPRPTTEQSEGNGKKDSETSSCWKNRCDGANLRRAGISSKPTTGTYTRW